MADLGKSSSDTAALKKFHTDGALPNREATEQEDGGTDPAPALGRMVIAEDFVR